MAIHALSKSVVDTAFLPREGAFTYLHCLGFSLTSTHEMITLVNNGVPQELHFGVGDSHARPSLKFTGSGFVLTWSVNLSPSSLSYESVIRPHWTHRLWN